MASEIIYRYFPDLSREQKNKFDALDELYRYWNDRINVISRKDIDHLYEHHVLHSLSIAKFIQFKSGSKVLDAGTGGGFPGIPLAIIFPETHFHLADSISKKIHVVNEIAKSLQLNNLTTVTERMEKLEFQSNFVVSRAVTRFPLLVSWVRKNLAESANHSPTKGIIYLKGEDTGEEEKKFGKQLEIVSIQDYFKEEFFTSKKLLFLSLSEK